MRDKYFMFMFFLGIALIITLGFFLDNWITARVTELVRYFLTQKGLLAPSVLVLEASMGLGMFTYLATVLFRRNYNPQGANSSQTHIWVFRDTGHKFRDVMEYEVYEREHGPGSWQKKVEEEKKGFIWIGLFVAVLFVAGFLALSGVFSGLFIPWAALGLGVGYLGSAGIHKLCNFLSDEYEFEETMAGDLFISVVACLYLVMIFLVPYFLYLLVFLLIPNAPEWMRTIYLGGHGAFIAYLVFLALLLPFLPVLLQLKGRR